MIDFLKYRPLTVVLCAVLGALFVGSVAYKYYTRGEIFVYSVDFTGGTQVLFGFSTPVTGEKVTQILENGGISGAAIRDFSETEKLVRVKQFESSATGLAGHMKEMFEASLPGTLVEVRQIDSIGGGVGEALRWSSIWAFSVGIFLMLLYIAFRFWSWGYALGAIFGLVHDIMIVLTIFIIFDLEISINVVGAILAVLGYSINDTIIIFTRIRENMGKLTNKTAEEIVNISTNETLRRTILTVFATTLVVVSLVLFGGEVLRSLSLVLLIGFIFGTYSSIFVASPIMLLIDKKHQE